MKSLQLSHVVWGVVTGFLFLPGLLIAQHGLSHVRVVRRRCSLTMLAANHLFSVERGLSRPQPRGQPNQWRR
jgi:hypothetical protein